MKVLKITKQNHLKPDIDELIKMRKSLKDFLDEDAAFNDARWMENFMTVLDFQDSDGSFKLLDSFKVPSDARVDFCHMPTYICAAILMKAYLTEPSAFSSDWKSSLFWALDISCARNFSGHGFDSLNGQIEALNVFMKAGLREFLDLHHDFCPKFSDMIDSLAANFAERQSRGHFEGSWGESYEDDIRAVNEYFSRRQVFVYGTLMEGECNHGYLENAKLLLKTEIEGYDMYSVGWYPAIADGNGTVPGELYDVLKKDMPAIDMLEGEGDLYVKRCETLTDSSGNKTFAFVYVYLEDCSGLERIASWKNDSG